MDGREGMGLSGSAPYYLHRRGVSGSVPNSGSHFGSGTQAGFAAPPPSFIKSLSNPNVSLQTNVRASHAGGSAYQADKPPPNLVGHGISTAVVVPFGVSSVDPLKRKRGRPRKYGPDGAKVSLGLSPMSSNPGGSEEDLTPVEKERKNRGRPRGSGRKQRLASLGDWMNSSAGWAFTPHVIHIGAGEDVSSKILSFAQQRPRALCILAANGSVSAVTLRQPTSSGDTITYEGRFEILCLSGSYLVAEDSGPHSRTGGLSISVCTPDGKVLGGAIGGRLIAASLVQAIVCSFAYEGSKIDNNVVADAKTSQISEVKVTENSSTPTTVTPSLPAPSSGMAAWPPGSRPGVRDPSTEIDLARG